MGGRALNAGKALIWLGTACLLAVPAAVCLAVTIAYVLNLG